MQKNKIILLLLFIVLNHSIEAQTTFHTKGTIKYEIKINNHKNAWWADDEDEANDEDMWKKNYIENTPKFSIYYFELKFANNKSLYNYHSRDESIKRVWDDDYRSDNIWYNDFNTGMYNNQKSIFGNVMRLEDSIAKLEWKFVAEDTRAFAGFNCKKATAKIFDSVYVFAYYSDEITPSVGPMSIVGLPGAIMVITIPRMHMSIVAKEFNPIVNEAAITPPKKSKLKSKKEVYDKIKENTKDWGKWAHKGIWASFI